MLIKVMRIRNPASKIALEDTIFEKIILLRFYLYPN